MRRCPHCGSRKIHLDLAALVQSGWIVLRPSGKTGVRLEWRGEALAWDDLNHLETHLCDDCGCEFDDTDA